MSGDDFEVVPQDTDDVGMWDVDDEDEDAIMQESVKSTCSPARMFLL
jgi:hypothetical protein